MDLAERALLVKSCRLELKRLRSDLRNRRTRNARRNEAAGLAAQRAHEEAQTPRRSSIANRRVRNRRRQAALDEARRPRDGESLAASFARVHSRRPRAVSRIGPPRKHRRFTRNRIPNVGRVPDHQSILDNDGDNARAENRRQDERARALNANAPLDPSLRRRRRNRRGFEDAPVP